MGLLSHILYGTVVIVIVVEVVAMSMIVVAYKYGDEVEAKMDR